MGDRVLGRSGAALLRMVLVAVIALTLVACGSDADAGSKDQKKITIGLSYVPNIQFAPFYVADAKGYFKDEGLELTLRHHTVGEDVFGALVAGQEDVMFAAGDETLMARSRDVDLVYVAQVWNKYPVALIAPADSGIESVADLKGRTVGIPGKYGATYIGLLALLESAGLTEDDVDIQGIGFTQVAALLDGKVDAVMGYMNNEPVQFEKAGLDVRTIPVNDVQPLISNGLVVLQETLDKDPDMVRAVIAATLKGVQFVLDNPDETVTISKDYVPGLEDPENAADALAVLQATIPLWQPQGTMGESDPAAWQSMAAFLESIDQLGGPVDADETFTNEYLP